MRKMKQETKKLFLRIIMLFMAFIMLLGFVLMPLTTVYAEETDDAVTDVVVSSFETGNLASAIEKAKDGTDLNLIKKIAVSGGVMNSADYSAVCAYPNVEYIELAGCETENGFVPDNCMQSRNQLTYISLPKNTETIGSRAFAGNRALIKISIPSTLRHIGEYAFQGCENVEQFNVPAELETLGTGAFADCKALTSFALPAAITEVPDYCFSKCNFTEMHFGPQITRIGDGAFSDCHTLTDIYFYGKTAPQANQSAFQNLKVTIHTYEDSDAEGFGSLENNFVSIGYDLSEDSVYEAPKPTVTNPAETEKVTETVTEEEKTAADTKEETSETMNETEKNNDSSDEDETEKETEAETEAATEADVPAAVQSSAFSGVSVIIIVVLVAALSVTVTLLIVSKKKG